MQLQKEHIVYQQEITSKNVHTCETPQREGNRLALNKAQESSNFKGSPYCACIWITLAIVSPCKVL